MFKYLNSGTITSIPGFKAVGLHCGLKKQKKDLAMIYSDFPAESAGTFTINKVKAAPLLVSQSIVKSDQKIRALIVNSGNANACTGEKGLNDALAIQEYCAAKFGLKNEEVLVSSTGVIGVKLNTEAIKNGIDKISLSDSLPAGHDAAEAIMTTDTKAKSFAMEVELESGKVIIGGICKGSGMIMPNMATMLAFTGTDAEIEKTFLQEIVSEAVAKSFNRISVDGDTSTNDMVILLANGASKIKITKGSDDAEKFKSALIDFYKTLAQSIVKDGEGATKFVNVIVQSAKNEKDADVIAKSIVNSPLVKTALNGADANWGRIISAAGYSGVDFDPAKVTIKIADKEIFKPGYVSHFDEDELKEILLKKDITITFDLGDGDASTEWWTCDFSKEYIEINASYRT
ncbi:MAG: bifunctional glutamate N-acetyltransferase/amino-acid acetyltransferase ArgJ [Melioribacteraceae bacterium]|nr:bifunctional glutamate N-acetyltransferase/amino-acid acetyltransferase ArgJ [Melioribacteraceae bacterium]MCF8263528.1 bifunctional glutamate N-acetyltransferase/amino-acid acetyltransferase ArgJ [Melioribacteraceae bacterium]MCF8411888.1 bifunctional glutamate N-acetyltransferase/amino-acid acetyltransferase ArgJ [Melioribacteraceae bacterium]MCF8431539.1 bifunctional glutamate N-acetyltransferase/amino-acid acetyltransferase ArgJ [Melioribacteraceae bacterium]